MSESQSSARKRGVTHVDEGESGSTASYGEQTDVETSNVAKSPQFHALMLMLPGTSQ